MKKIVLSSSSPARKKLLERLAIPFETVNPDIDESPLPGELPHELVSRLSLAKARAHQQHFSNALIIGSDQVAVFENDIIGKPNTHENAVQMLKRLSGQEIIFYTGLCLLNSDNKYHQFTVEKYTVVYNTLSLSQIESYLEKEKPYGCAGSTKIEGLGIALMKELRGKDPTALIGIPLIALVGMLRNEGYEVI